MSIEENIKTSRKDKKSPPMLQVLRSFDINRPGLSINKLTGGVLGGTLFKGTFSIDEDVEIRPGNLNQKTNKYEPIFTKISSLGSSAGLVESVNPGGLIAVGTKLDPSLTKSDSLVGAVVGYPNEVADTHENLDLKVDLFDFAIGSPDMLKVDKIKNKEALRLNAGTAITAGLVANVKNDIITITLRRPITAEYGSQIAISRRLGDRWRLIGVGVIS